MAAAPARYESSLCYFERGSRARVLDAAAARLDAFCAEPGHAGWPCLVRAIVALSLIHI